VRDRRRHPAVVPDAVEGEAVSLPVLRPLVADPFLSPPTASEVPCPEYAEDSPSPLAERKKRTERNVEQAAYEKSFPKFLFTIFLSFQRTESNNLEKQFFSG